MIKATPDYQKIPWFSSMLSLAERTKVHRFKDPITAIALMGSVRTVFRRTPASLPGGYSVGVPPDPIPNSAVKPDSADGTIAQAMEE